MESRLRKPRARLVMDVCSLCPPGEMVIVREEIRPKGCSSRRALRASDKGVQEHSRKHLAGLAINGHFEHKRNINA